MKQEMLILHYHMDSAPDFGVVGAANLFKSLFCVLFVFVLCLWCPMLPVYLDCSFLITLSVFSDVYLLIISHYKTYSFDIFDFLLLIGSTIKKQKIHFQDKYNKNVSSRSTVDY